MFQESPIRNTRRDRRRIAKILLSIGDWERISDYAQDLSKITLKVHKKVRG